MLCVDSPERRSVDQPGEPVHDVESELSVVANRHVHAHLLGWVSIDLRRQVTRLSHHDDPTIAELERDSLGPACRRNLLVAPDVLSGFRELEQLHTSGRTLE